MQNFTAWIYSLFNPCSKYESLIITEAYEGLSEAEKEELQSHISACDKCRRNYNEILGFVLKIERIKNNVLDSLKLEEVDLLPQLMYKIEEKRPNFEKGVLVNWRVPLSVGVSVAVLLFVFWGYVNYTGNNSIENGNVNVSVASIGELKNIAKSGDVPLERQKEKLRNIVEKYSGQNIAGEALLMLADIEYYTEEKYEEAHKLYRQLREFYPNIFSSSPQAIYRYNLLEEVCDEGYKPLYILNSSLANLKDPIQQLEGIVKQYPGSLVAQLAVQKMVECYGDEKSLSSDAQIALLESLKGIIMDPTVVAHVDYMLGDLYWKQKSDLKRAEKLFESVYYSGPPSLKPKAYDALVQLVSTTEK